MSDFVNSENQDSVFYRFKLNFSHQLNPFTTIVTIPLNPVKNKITFKLEEYKLNLKQAIH